MYVYDGDAASLPFDFVVNGEFVSPSAATYTVRDHSGVAITGLVDQAIVLSAGATSAIVAVAADKNTLGGATVQNRTVIVKFIYGGNTFQIRKSYTVVPFLPYTADAAKVRSLLGLFDHELRDDEVDLVRAYYAVQDEATKAILDAAMVATDNTNVRANDAITIRAAIAVIPSLRLRAIQKTSDDNVEVSRLSKIDFDGLADDLAQAYSQALQDLNPDAVDVTPTLLLVTTPTDPITNA